MQVGHPTQAQLIHSGRQNSVNVQTGESGSNANNGSRGHVSDKIDLSETARHALHADGPGKSALSPAHSARTAIESNGELADLPFGRVVSAISQDRLDSLIDDNQPSIEQDGTSNADGAMVPEPASEITGPSSSDQPATPMTDTVAVAENTVEGTMFASTIASPDDVNFTI